MSLAAWTIKTRLVVKMKNKQVIKELINALEECLADIEVRSYFEDEEDWKETIAFLNKHRDTMNNAKARIQNG